MNSVTIPAYNLEQITALTAAGFDVIIAATEPSALVLSGPPALRAGQPEGLKAAKKHCYDRRMARAEATARGGLTKTHRQTLARELEAKHGGEYTTRQWNAGVKAFKAAGRHI